MANYSRWDDVKKKRPAPDAVTRSGVEQDLDLGQLIYDLRTEAGLSQRELAERMGTTQSVISRLEEGGGARNRLDTLARVATALDRHLIVSFPEKAPAKLKDAVQVASPEDHLTDPVAPVEVSPCWGHRASSRALLGHGRVPGIRQWISTVSSTVPRDAGVYRMV